MAPRRVNPIIGYALSGKDSFRPVFEPAAKVAVNTQLGFAVGAEWYAELGFLDDLLPAREQSHYLFGVVDLVEAHGRPSLGVGAQPRDGRRISGLPTSSSS